jgi:hypothetical protein
MRTERPRVHLVTFATSQFRHRQAILSLSARLNGVCGEVSEWTVSRLQSEGFEKSVPGIGLHERGAGFYAWKPFVISQTLKMAEDGEVVLYCDVGRVYPFKLLDQPLDPFLDWMRGRGQDVMPGIEIPWDGPMIRWTKRDALMALGMDTPEVHFSTPIQASFSIWRVSQSSRAFASEWLGLCGQRQLVSDDPCLAPEGEYHEFQENRWDQALLSLLCMKRGVRGIFLGAHPPSFDAKNPSEVLKIKWPDKIDRTQSIAGMAIRTASQMMSLIEKPFRGRK